MNHVKELKRKLGAGYSYKKYMGEKQIARLKKQPPYDFVEQRAVSLTAGCVRIDAVLFRSTTGLAMAYDVFVKDAPDSDEWLCYDSLSIPVSLREADMLSVLDRVVRENGLSYTECCFQKLEGKTIKEKYKMITNDSSPL